MERRAIDNLVRHAKNFGAAYTTALEILVRDICNGAYSWGQPSFKNAFDSVASRHLLYLCFNIEDPSLSEDKVNALLDANDEQGAILIGRLHADCFPDEDSKKN